MYARESNIMNRMLLPSPRGGASARATAQEDLELPAFSKPFGGPSERSNNISFRSM